jgi:hypothetical protein
MALTQEQLDKLREHVLAGDRIGYYSQLAEWGDVYAALALGVVRADTLSGRTPMRSSKIRRQQKGSCWTTRTLPASALP